MNVNKLFLVLKIDLPHLECFHSFIFVSEVNLFWRPEKKSVYIHSTLHTCSTFSCIAGSYNINSKSPACCTCARCNHILASILFAWRKDYIIKSSTCLKKKVQCFSIFFWLLRQNAPMAFLHFSFWPITWSSFCLKNAFTACASGDRLFHPN